MGHSPVNATGAAAAASGPGYRALEACRIVGISYRQLDHWARTGLIEPSFRSAGGSGTHRLYSFMDLVQLRLVKRLRDTGISLSKIRVAVEWLRTRDYQGQSSPGRDDNVRRHRYMGR